MKKTKFSFVVPNVRYGQNHLWSVLPSRGLLSLAAVLRQAGYDVQIIDADIDSLSDSQVLKQIISFGTNAVGITMNTFQADSGKILAEKIKSELPAATIIIGGPHPSALKNSILDRCPAFDIACMGESEETILELARAIDNKKSFQNIKGIAYRNRGKSIMNAERPQIRDLDTIPVPAYELAGDLDRYPGATPILKPPSMHIMASRGCPFHCIFCTKSVWGDVVRFRRPEDVVKEIRYLHEYFGINEIFFQDDTMNLDSVWFLDICRLIISNGLHESMAFKASFRVDNRLVTREILRAAKEAGFWAIFYGVESGSQKVLDQVRKNTTVEDIKKAFKLTHEEGLKTIAAFMVGNVGDTEKTIAESVDLANEIRPFAFGFSIATPLPGTEFFHIASEKGWIETGDFRQFSQFSAASRNKDLSANQITLLRDRADYKARYHLCSMDNQTFFDNHWQQVIDFIKQNSGKHDKILAPVQFELEFGARIIPDNDQDARFATLNWVVIHKGRVREINPFILNRSMKDAIPVFANQVFVVFAHNIRKNIDPVDLSSNHYQALLNIHHDLNTENNYKSSPRCL